MPTKDDTWSRRHSAIREVLSAEMIRNQGQLASRLRRRGFTVTQPSISRDLRELGAVKIDGRYVLRDTLAGRTRSSSQLSELAASITRIDAAGPYTLIVRTPPGRAPAVSAAIDESGWSELIGSLAGDDTIFLATNGRRDQAALEARLRRLAKEG